MMSSSSSPTFSPSSFHVPKPLTIPPRNQSLPRKLPSTFPQLTSTFPFHFSRKLHQCFAQRQSQSTQQKEQEPDDEELEIERLFSNLNQATLKRDPGSLSSSILLVTGTTVGAGTLAIPAVTQESGFLASAVVCIICWVFMAVTGLLIAEVNVNTMCELGSGGVSLVSMARRTLGTAGVQIACWSYIFIHYALLIAYVARSTDILTDVLGIPAWESAALFSLVFGGLCFFGSQRFIGAVNGILVFGLIGSFAALVGFRAYLESGRLARYPHEIGAPIWTPITLYDRCTMEEEKRPWKILSGVSFFLFSLLLSVQNNSPYIKNMKSHIFSI